MHQLPPLPSSAAFITFISLVACGHEELPSAPRTTTSTTHSAAAPVSAPQASAAQAPTAQTSAAQVPATPTLTAPPAASTSANGTPSAPVDTKPSGASARAKGFPELKRLVVAKHVENREPVGDGPLVARQPLVAFLEFSNPSPSPLSVQVTFEHEGGTRVGFVELGIPAHSLRYRTWARSHNVGLPGHWSAVVRDDSGEEVDRQAFFVEPAS